MESIRKKRKTFNTILLLVIAASILVYAHETGITGATLKNGFGCDCHSPSPSANVMVAINGPEMLAVNETGNFTVTISGGPLVRGGTNIAASTGSLAPAGPDLQILSLELTHTQPKAPSGGSVIFEFTYTAPENPGEITLYANGNSVNFNGENTGDQWNFAPNKIITVSSATGIEDEQNLNSYILYQNYPNPFNPSTNISYRIPAPSHVKLIIFDSFGNTISTPVDGYKNEGNYNYEFMAEGLASGIYYYSIRAENFSETRKMLLLK
jgi:hypothetical protein